MVASEYGIKNLKVILASLPEWTKEKGEGYENLTNMYGQLTGQFGRYMGHVAKNVGGIYENPKTVDQAGPIYERTSAATQKEAMDFLNRNLFTTPKWLANQAIMDNIEGNPLEVISRLQGSTLTRLVSNSTLSKLVAAEATDGATAYKITDLFNDLNAAIFTELKSNATIDVYRRNLQKAYLQKLIAIAKPAPASASLVLIFTGSSSTGLTAAQSDVLSVVKGQLRELQSSIKSAISSQSDSLSKYHLADLNDRIEAALNNKD